MYSFSCFLPLSDDGGANNPSGAGLERSQHELLVHGHCCRGRMIKKFKSSRKLSL